MADPLDIETARYCFDSIEKTDARELRVALYKAALRYETLRLEWQQLPISERQGLDEIRTRAHDVFIDSCNILSRYMVKNGEQIDWREKLGSDRKIVGDFACYICLFLALKAR